VLGPPAGQGRVVVSGRPAAGRRATGGLHVPSPVGSYTLSPRRVHHYELREDLNRKKKFQAPRTAPQRGSTRATRSRGAQSRRPPAVPVYWAREVDSARGLAEYGQGGLGRVHTPCVTARSRFAEFCRGLAELSGPRLGTPAGRDRAGCVLGGSPCKRLRPGPRLAPAWRCARRLGEGRRAAWVATV
jgi:hypothetical protein